MKGIFRRSRFLLTLEVRWVRGWQVLWIGWGRQCFFSRPRKGDLIIPEEILDTPVDIFYKSIEMTMTSKIDLEGSISYIGFPVSTVLILNERPL